MKNYLLNFFTPKTLIKKLGIVGLIIVIPCIMARIIINIVFGSWLDALLSLLSLLTLLLGWDMINYFINNRKSNPDQPNVTKPSSDTKEDGLDLEALMKAKNIKK